MKILHLPFTYYPDPVGGTEVYVAALIEQLADMGIASAVAAPWSQDREAVYDHAGARVYRFPVPPPADLTALYGTGDSSSAAAIQRIITTERPDVLHMHSHTRAHSAIVARSARKANLPVVFTYHTPTVSCQRGTLLRYGRIPCDGRVLITRCSACIAQQHGAGPASWFLAALPPALGRLVGRLGRSRPPWSSLRLTELLSLRKRAFHELMANAALVVAVSEWVARLLVVNGIPEDKITLSRQGTYSAAKPPVVARRTAGAPLRAVMLGRLDPAKGLAILLGALAHVPSLPISLDVYGVEEEMSTAGPGLRDLASREPRVRLLPSVPNDKIIETIARYDVTLVPSQVLETGPLVVLESFAAGVPVIGSRLGGIAERVRDGIDGILVDSADATAWATCLTRVANESGVLPTLAAGIVPQRTMRDVAEQMRDVYKRVVPSSSGGWAEGKRPA